MTDQLVGWLGDADRVVTAATILVQHLHELGHALGDIRLPECGLLYVLHRTLRGAWGRV